MVPEGKRGGGREGIGGQREGWEQGDRREMQGGIEGMREGGANGMGERRWKSAGMEGGR